MQLIEAKDRVDDGSYYGAPCLPTVRGKLWKCASREEYLGTLTAYEAAEASCNTCKHLIRTPGPKCPQGFLNGTCAVTKTVLRFHPEDPGHKPCWVSRRSPV